MEGNPRETLSLRPATEDDIPTLVEIEKRVHKSPWDAKAFQGELEKPQSHILLLTDDETDSIVHGYIVYWLFMGDCEIHNVAVDVSFRRQGFGKWMIRKVLSEAARAGSERVFLYVRASNNAAIHLYQATGFTTTQIRRGFYSDGEDAYHMEINKENLTHSF